MSFSLVRCENWEGSICDQGMQRDLCEHLMENIFKRLPLKSLCQFRSVCKAWNTLFCSQSFINFYTTYNRKPGKRSYLLKDEWSIQYSPSYPLYTQQQDGENSLTHLPSPVPKELKVIGVINGVVCLASVASTVFWNPAIRKYIAIKNRKYDVSHFDIGFGYDAAKKDFKAVMTALPRHDVFSVENATWRESIAGNVIGGYRTVPWCDPVFTNGAIYWIGINRSLDVKNCTFVLLMFDCVREQFEIGELRDELIPQDSLFDPSHYQHPYHAAEGTPEEIWNRTNGSDIGFLKLGTYGEKLLMQKQSLCNNSWCYEVWVMEGETKAWNKLVKVDRYICLASNVVLLGEGLDGYHISCLDLEQVSSPLYEQRCEQRCVHQQPLNGLVYEKSSLLMDVKAPDPTHLQSQHQSLLGKVYLNYVNSY